MSRVAILLDGGFVKKKLAKTTGHFPTIQDVLGVVTQVMALRRLGGSVLFRIYYYDAPPLTIKAKNPIDNSQVNFAATPQATLNVRLIDLLELRSDFAVRRGDLMLTGWKLGRSALKSLATQPRVVTGQDLVPDIGQKGVDIRIGLDIAWLALKRVVDTWVFVTGDSDFVAPMKFARKERLKVYLEILGHGVRRELKAHADLVL